MPDSLVLLEQHTAAGSASLDFTAFLSALYETYLVEVIGIMPATDAVDFALRMSTDGGATYPATDYYWDHFVWRAGGTAVGGTGTGTGSPSSELTLSHGLIDRVSTSIPGIPIHGWMELVSPGSGAFYKSVRGQLAYLDTAGPFRLGVALHGWYNSLAAVNALRFFMSAGNIASGTIRMYGLGAAAVGGSFPGEPGGGVW